MQKTKAVTLTALLLTAFVIALLPMAKASTGYILINTATPPSTVGQQVQAGGSVSLYFGGVTWSGGQFYLLLSRDGFSQVSPGDMLYTPTFNLANLTSSTISTYTGANGTWLVGDSWVNGSIPLNIAGGNYFIKAFDGTATSVAVTDTYITVTAAFRVVPTQGAGGTSISLNGYAFGPNALVNLSYFNPISVTWVSIVNLTAADSLGQFVYPMLAPDLKQLMPTGDNPLQNNTITFRAVENATSATYNADYTEFKRGLLSVGSRFATGLYGNATDFAAVSPIQVLVGVGSSLRIAGNWFYPGNVTFLWDGATTVGTTTANGTGYFNTTITVPMTGVGGHTIVINDQSVNNFVIYVNVSTTLTLNPTKGPVGTVVTATGYGYPSSSGSTVYNVTLTWYGYTNRAVGWALTDASGYFTTTFVVPRDYGSGHTVTGVANDTASTSASATFSVTPTLIIDPAQFSNNASLMVYARGTGFDPSYSYTPNIDNNYLGIDPLDHDYTTSLYPNATGDITIGFVGAGFRPGLHVFTIYQSGTTAAGTIVPYAYATFTVLSTGDPIADLLASVNRTLVSVNGTVATISTDVGTIKTDVSVIKANVTSIMGTVATISTTVGTIQTSVSSINAMVTSINNGIATIQTDLGTVKTSVQNINPRLTAIEDAIAVVVTDVGTVKTDVEALNPTITSIQGDVATVKTDVGTLKGTVTSIDGNVATVKTDVGTLKATVATVQTDVETNLPNQITGLSTPIWIAVILSLIAAIAAIASIILVRKKIAG